MLIKKVADTVYRHKLIDNNDHILVGLSGGQDSIFMLDALLAIQKDLNFKISIGHFNHKVRGEYADRDQNFCQKLAKNYNIDFYTDSYNMDLYAKEKKISSEEAGRYLRKRFFKETMEKSGAYKIALAHNKDDQVETVLMRIIRGTGIDGLEGIEYKSKDIIRPILDISREELEEYIIENKLEYVQDHTNFENIYYRNKIRNILIPYLEKEYNPEIKSALHNLSSLASFDKEYLLKESERNYNNIVKVEESNYIILKKDELNYLDKALASRIIRKVFEKLCGYINDISFINIEQVLDLAQGETGKKINNIRGIEILNSYNDLIFNKIDDNIKKLDYYIPLKLGINNIYENKSIYLEEVDFKGNDSALYIPKDQIKGNLVARNRKVGDKIKLPNMKGRKKVKDIFIDEKIPRYNRDKYIIITDNVRIYSILTLRDGEIEDSNSNIYIKLTIINGGEYA